MHVLQLGELPVQRGEVTPSRRRKASGCSPGWSQSVGRAHEPEASLKSGPKFPAAGPDLDEAVPQAAASSGFNREYRTPTPGLAILATRLRRLLAGGEVIALLAGVPAVVRCAATTP